MGGTFRLKQNFFYENVYKLRVIKKIISKINRC